VSIITMIESFICKIGFEGSLLTNPPFSTNEDNPLIIKGNFQKNTQIEDYLPHFHQKITNVSSRNFHPLISKIKP